MLRRTVSPTAVQFSSHASASRGDSPVSRRIGVLAPALAILAGFLCVRPASASPYYWFGDDNNVWNTTVGPGGSNWSSSGVFNNGTGGLTALPTSTSDVFFVLAGANNLTTELGANFTINSLTFTTDATSPVQINDTPGTHTLTIGVGGITDNGPSTYTINAPVALGAVETWSNNAANPLAFNGVISGAAANNLTIAGSGAIVLSGENTYSGTTTVFTGTLRVSGAGGSIRGSSGVSLGAGTTLTLDSTVANEASQDRVGDSTTITSNGGFINLLGNSSAPTTETVGQLATASGASYVTVTPGAGQTATLTFGGVAQSFTHTAPGGTVTFSPTGTVMAPNQPLVNPTNPIIGGWATIGTVSSTVSNTLDWATVNVSKQVVPLAAYQTFTNAPTATDNAKADFSAGQVTFANTQSATINTLYVTGNSGPGDSVNDASQVDWTSADPTVQAGRATGRLTITSGGILATDAGGTGHYDNKLDIPNMAFIGPNTPAPVNNTLCYQGQITSGFFPTATTAELDVFTTATGNLRLASFIVDPDATHHLTLVKSGPGLLDLSNGNTQNRKIATTDPIFTGKVVINEGILLINAAPDLGANPAAFVADQVTFNGGELRTFAGLTPNANAGWTVGTRGGTFTYTGGGTSNINNKITGVGGFTYYSRAFGGGTNQLITLGNNLGAGGTQGNDDYQGPATFWISLSTDQTQFGRIGWNRDNQIPATSAVTMNIVDDTPAHNIVPNANLAGNPASLNLANANGNHSDHFGSLAGNLNMRNFNGTLTIGGNNLSTVYTGSLYGAAAQALQADTTKPAGTGTLVKVGTGTQTFGGAFNNYTGATNVNGGKLLIGNGTAITDSVAALTGSTVNVGNGAAAALGGNGTINGAVNVNAAGGTLAPAMSASTFNTLTINSNNLTINPGGALSYNFASPGAGALNIGAGSGDLTTVIGTGNLSLPAGADVLNVNQLAGFGLGTYPLIEVTGTGTFTDAATFTVNGKPNFNYAVLQGGQVIDASLGGGTVTANQLWLEVLQGNPQLTWIGNLTNVWDINITANWAGDNTKFTTGSNVNFNDFSTGGHNNPVSVVAGGVNPNTVSIDGSGAAAAGQDFTFSGGAITVTSTLTKNQAGSVTFNDNVTAPITTVTSGSITVGATSTYSSPTKFDLNGGSLLVNGILNTPALTVATGSNLTVAAAGLLGSSTFLGNSDTVIFNQAAQSLAGIGGPGSLTLNGTALTLTSGVSSYSGPISGTGASLLVNGATAVVTLSGNNTYTGGTSVTAGILRAGSLTAFGTNPALTISGTGTLDVDGTALNGSIYTNVSVGGAGVGGNGALINTGGSQDNALLGVTMTADTTFGGTSRWVIRGVVVNPTTTTTATVTGGGFNLTKTGANTIGLGATKALITGVKNININQGTLFLADTTTLDNTVAGSIFLNPTGTLSIGNYASPTGVIINKPIVMAGGTLQTDAASANGNATLAVPISLNAAGNVNAQLGSTLTLNGAIANGTSSTGGMTYSGSGTVVLGSASNYGGPTTINGPSIREAAANNTLPTGTSLALNSGVLDLAGHNQQVVSLSGSGTIRNSAASTSTFTVTGSAPSTFNGPIQDDGPVALVQAGSGALTLGGTSTYSGGTVINSGNTVVAQGIAGNPLGTGAVTLQNGSTLVLNPIGAGVVGFNNGAGWIVNSTGNTSAPFPTANVLQLTNNVGNEARSAFFNRRVAVNNGFTAQFTYTPSGDIAADGAAFVLQVDTRGAAALGGNGGSLGDSGAIGTRITPAVAVELNIYTGAAGGIGTLLDLNGVGSSVTNPYNSVAPVNLASGDPIAVTLTFNAGTTTLTEKLTDTITGDTFTQAYSVDIVGNNTSNTAFLGFTGATGGSQATQLISNFTYTAPGGGSGIYSTPVTLTGGTSSTISVAATSSVPVMTMGGLTVGSGGPTTLNIAPAASVPMNQAYGLTFGAVSLSSNTTLNMGNNGTGTGTLTLGAVGDGGTSSSLTFAGGTLVLTAAGSYGGGTNINSGTLQLANASGSATGTGPVIMASGTALIGTGAISGPFTLNGTAHLSPGVGTGGIGTLNLGASGLATNSILDYDLAGVAFDTTHAGALTLGTNLNVNLNLLAGFTYGTYNLVTSTGITGSPTFVVTHTGPGDNAAFTYNVAESGNNIFLTVNATVQKWTGAAGAAGNGAWDTTSVNWDPAVNGGIYQDNLYQQLFDDTGLNTNITIAAPVTPLGVRFANSAVPYTISGSPINGGGVVVIQGGTVNLKSLNGYTGGTNLLGGTLNLGDPAAIGTGTLSIAGGQIDNTSGGAMTLTNNNAQLWAGSFTFLGTSNLNLGTGAVTLATTPTVTVAAATLEVDGSIGDIGAGYGFTKDGLGSLVLMGANTYSGTTTLLNGTLQVLGTGTLGGGTAGLTVSGGSLDLGGTNQSVGAVTITAGTPQNGTLTATSFAVNNPADLTLGSTLVLAGTGGLTKTLGSTLILAGTNTYSGGTTVNGGTVSIATDANLGAPATLTLNGGTLLVTAGTAANTTATLSAGRGITLGPLGGTLSIGFVDTVAGNHLNSEIALVYSGIMTGPGNLTVIGQAGINQTAASILDLDSPGTYLGSTTINNAIAQVNSGTSAPSNGAAVVNVLPTGTTLNLINNGAWNIDANSSNLAVAGLTGDATGRFGTSNNTSISVLTLDGAGVYSFPGIIGQLTVAGKTGTDGILGLMMAGTGTQTLSGANTYAGGTTVNSGTLTTTATGTIGGAGTLAVNAADTITSALNLGNNQTVTDLSGTLAGSGSASINVSAGITLTSNQAATGTSTFAGNLVLATGPTANSGGTFTKSGVGILEIDGAPTLGANSNVNVSGGTLRFNVTPTSSGSVFVGTGVTATVTNTAVLELAGSISALDPLLLKGKANVVNNSTAAAGLLVSGTNQLVGFVDGSGTTQVNAGSDLTASHIVQGALVIGGTAMSAGLVTIDPSDANGNPLATSSSLAVAGSLAPSGPFGPGTLSSSSPLAGGSSSSGSSLGSAAGGALSSGGGASTVPEPSTLLMALLGLVSAGLLARRKRK